MSGTNYSWVEEQLTHRRFEKNTAQGARVYTALLELLHTLDAQSLTDELKLQVVDLFASFAVAAGGEPEEGGSYWKDYVVGVTHVGETVRVRRTAYEGIGAVHNGLVGTITGIRGGRVLVQYKGRTEGLGHSHHPDFLEVLAYE